MKNWIGWTRTLLKPAVSWNWTSRLAAARTSTAGRPDASVAAIRRAQAEASDAYGQAADQELQALIDRARRAETAGKTAAARIYYEMVARRATGSMKADLVSRIRSLRATESGER